MIHVCVPVLTRYDLLENLLRSLHGSIAPIEKVVVVDNGLQHWRPETNALSVEVFTPAVSMGLAETWNWFIKHVPEERFIVNDDIEFAPHSLEAMIASQAPFVSCSFGFSCFLLRDACVQTVGLFDETLSPGYAYFEDMDYLRRMRLAGVIDDVVMCDVAHHQSATPEKYSKEQWDAHHEKFALAQNNYTAKWAGDPSWEQLKTIGGNGAHE